MKYEVMKHLTTPKSEKQKPSESERLPTKNLDLFGVSRSRSFFLWFSPSYFIPPLVTTFRWMIIVLDINKSSVVSSDNIYGDLITITVIISFGN